MLGRRDLHHESLQPEIILLEERNYGINSKWRVL